VGGCFTASTVRTLRGRCHGRNGRLVCGCQVGDPLRKVDNGELTAPTIMRRLMDACKEIHADDAAAAMAASAVAATDDSDGDGGGGGDAVPVTQPSPAARRASSSSSAAAVSSSVLVPPCPVTEGMILVKPVFINYGKDCVTGRPGFPLRHVLFWNPKVGSCARLPNAPRAPS